MATSRIRPKKKARCKLCGRVFIDKAHLVAHIDNVHHSQIPEGWSATRYECYLRTGKIEGHCIYCGKPTGFNEKTGKYFRLCKDPKCRKAASDAADRNMIGKFGKTTLLDDPEQQRKMVYARKNSGKYVFEDPDEPRYKYTVMYDSSYGKDFLEMLDNFLMFSGQDIIGPSPHTYYYEYEGKRHFYIPDFYIPSLNLEVEIKDGGSNPNTHPKIQAIDKVKEKIKDELMESMKNQINYIKIVNKEYGPFYALLSELKEQDTVYVPKWATPTALGSKESISEVLSNIVSDMPTIPAFDKTPVAKNVKQAAMVFDPVVSYDELMDQLYDEVRKCKSPAKMAYLDGKIRTIRDHLSKVANSEWDEDQRMKYEARKAIKKIDSKILPYLETRNKRLMKVKEVKEKLGKKQTPTNESVEYWVDGSVMEGSNTREVKIPVYVVLTDTRKPIAEVIKKATGEPYGHASLSLDTSMQNMFSFNMTGKGFDTESIFTAYYGSHQDIVRYSIYCYMASPDEFNLIKAAIEDIRSRAEKFRYDIAGLVGFYSKHKKLKDDAMICSEFVASMLKAMNPNMVTKERNRYTPYGLTKIRKLFFVQRGVLKNFSPEKLYQTTKRKIEEAGYTLWDSNKPFLN